MRKEEESRANVMRGVYMGRRKKRVVGLKQYGLGFRISSSSSLVFFLFKSFSVSKILDS